MRQHIRSTLWLLAILWLALGATVPAASAANMTLLPGTDLPGYDYAIHKNTNLDACKSTCLGDGICRAFTFNKKARWCFLKGNSATESPAPDAVSGKLVQTLPDEAIAAQRRGELPFPPNDLIAEANRFALGLPVSDPPPPGATYFDLVKAADEAVAKANPAAAIIAYKQALAIVPNDPDVWLKLAKVATLEGAAAAKRNPYASDTTTLTQTAISASLEGFFVARTVTERAQTLGAIAQALTLRQMWVASIATYRASLALADNADLAAQLDKVVAEHGFRVTSNEIDAESAAPRICAVFSGALSGGNTDLSGYVSVADAPKVAVETEQSQICITGVQHGRRYHIKLRAGLLAANGETLRKDVELNLYVPDRKPFVGFANNAYVLPAGLGGGLPISSVNAKTADVVIYRIGDRSIVTAVRNGIFQGTLDGSSAESIADEYGEKAWSGEVDLAQGPTNAMMVTAIPIAGALKGIKPGAYVVTARIAGSKADYWSQIATQWFIVTDLGLTTVSGSDGVHAFVRSLDSAKPVSGAKVRLLARNNEVLGETISDADGRADFAPGLSRGEGGKAPQLLVAETSAGDYAFLDVSKSAFDLTDRGVDGRPSPGPLDLFATTERGVYRPGETVFLNALLRDSHAEAVAGLPLTMKIERPDGVVSQTRVLKDKGAGGYFTDLQLIAGAMRGSWRIRLYVDPKADALANVNFLVEDFEPERLAFEVSAPEGPVSATAPIPVNVAAKYLYGATAPDLAVEADAILRPTSTLKAFPGYRFGRTDDTIQTDREPLGVVGTTDKAGKVVAEVSLPTPQATTRPLVAQIILRLVDSNGRPVERSLTRPVRAQGNRLGIKPQFNSTDAIPADSDVGFDVIAASPDNQMVAQTGVNWTLSRLQTSYQWYKDGGTWKWEAITTTRKIANGTIDTPAGKPASVTAPIRSGRYQFEVATGGENPTSTSYQFYAGYYYPEAGSDTPDKLQVALDKKVYRPGETAHLRLDPQFAGTALVMVLDDTVIDMKAVDVPAGGTTVDLPVTDKWSPGAYVTATLYRPADAAAKRMPARALGLAFADVDPGDRKFEVSLAAPKETLPRHPFTVKVSLANAKAGEKAYVSVAAVDLGILNLTAFKTPDPDGWFFGQRQLGVELRDLYGQLIDPTQGSTGALRSGGDAAAPRLGTSPPTSVLVAQHAGIVEVGADGTATVSFDMPDFNGTVRVMAMAWSKAGVGHASADVVVHDPVVVTLSPPRFLRVGDKSRLLVEVNNVSGPAGTYALDLVADDGLSLGGNAKSEVNLDAGARNAFEIGLTATAVGDQKLTLTITGPDGKIQIKNLTLGVRATSAPTTNTNLIHIAPGASVTLDAARFKDFTPHSSSLALAIGPMARLNVPELLLALDRYPYGCAEQVTSRALPLLYLNEVATTIGLGTDAALHKRVQDGIADLLSKQTSSGGFGLWGANDASTLWLDSYVTDFLLRAKKHGYVIPEVAMTRALDNLGNQVSAAPDFDNGGEDVAYALYDSARAGRAAIGDLRYYFEARLDAFASPLAKAQIGAALALYGDRTRSSAAFKAALTGLNAPLGDENSYRADYGSRLRDTAGVLALAAEFTPEGVDIAALTERLAILRAAARYTSTQEDGWTLLAAAALADETTGGQITLNGAALTGTVYRRYNQETITASPVTITNNGDQPSQLQLSVTGTPITPPPASSNGFAITRNYYLPDGTRFDPGLSQVHQNDRFVVVLTMSPTRLGSGQYMVADPLPAGFEIENPDLSAGAGVADLSWLQVDTPTHIEARTDQFVAAFRYTESAIAFSAAYMVRAVSPGNFVLPGATVEDMYRPQLRANTASGSVEILPPAGTPTPGK